MVTRLLACALAAACTTVSPDAQALPLAERSVHVRDDQTGCDDHASNDGQDGWFSEVNATLTRQEYFVSPRNEGQAGFAAPNRAKNLRARWQDGRLELSPRVDGEDAVRIRELKVLDADGIPLSSRFDVGPGRISIVFDDHGATYPITVDPLITSPAWSVESDQADAQMGMSVGTAGDVNGDSY